MDEKSLKKFWKHLESEAWEDFLDMSVGQAGLWAGMNVEPEKVGSEIMPTEPYMLGSHSGCCGIWCSGPDEDWVPDVQNDSRAHKYKWGYNRMTTVDGLFTAGDGVGASGHKFSSGSHAEGRICAKQMVNSAVTTPTSLRNSSRLRKNSLMRFMRRSSVSMSSRALPPLLISTPTTSSPPV